MNLLLTFTGYKELKITVRTKAHTLLAFLYPLISHLKFAIKFNCIKGKNDKSLNIQKNNNLKGSIVQQNFGQKMVKKKKAFQKIH